MRIIIIFLFTSLSSISQTIFDTKSFGKKILDGTARPSDDAITFRVLDSLFCKNQAEKDFYFKVARKIQTMTDGALGEYFSGIASKYYLEYTADFIINSAKLTAKEIEDWLNQACYDISATAQGVDSLPKIKKRLDNLVTNCNCSDTQRATIRIYNKSLYSCVDEAVKNP